MTKVEEDPLASDLTTQYSYDPLGDLTTVTQGSQTRSFSYDNQGWLQLTTQPESGNTFYTQDVLGNIATKTDACGITTYYTYDALNRLTHQTYSDGTAEVIYTYDSSNIPYSIGRLTQMFSNGTYTTNQAFDPLGNVVASSQLTAGSTYTFGYTYNLAGALTSETFPSGRKLTYGYDGAGRENSLGGALGGQGKWYVTYMSYTPDNQIGLIDYGNNVWRATSYNNRLQPVQTLDVINNDPTKLLRTQCFYWGSSINLHACTSPATPDNNGNLRATLLGYGTGGATTSINFNETFGYDGVNRLTSAIDSGGWSRTFGYDRYGNMWVPSTTGIPLQGGTVATVNNYNAATNRINGASYDAAGNLTSFTGSALTYDAENRITGASQSGVGSMYYFYDGAGRRVQEVSTYNVEKVFVYDAFGQMAAEYSLGAQSPPCTTCYIATDHLGSTRLVTDQNANVVGRHDYLPFGEEIAANAGGRDGTFGTQDFVNQKFTGQARDSETGLDFFQARYYSAALGRFNSPDPGNAGANLFNPQSWNGYSYVMNDPLVLVDPSGMIADGRGPMPPVDGCIWDSAYGALDCGGTSYPGCVSYGTQGCIPPPCSTTASGCNTPPPPGAPYGGGGGGGGKGAAAEAPPKSGIGIRAPGQTFGACMAQHANGYSMGGLLDTSYGLATGKDSSLSTNPLASFVLGNSINTLLFGSGGEAASAALGNAPTAITGGMGNALTYGRRTSDIMALNLAGRGGLPVALGRSSAGVKAMIGKGGSFLSLGLSFTERMGLDVAFTGAEAVDCSMTF